MSRQRGQEVHPYTFGMSLARLVSLTLIAVLAASARVALAKDLLIGKDDFQVHRKWLETDGALTEGEARAIYDRYVLSVERLNDARASAISWSGRWMQEHIYWTELRDWQQRLRPRRDLSRIFETLRKSVEDRYVADLRRALPQRSEGLAAIERDVRRLQWMLGRIFGGRMPDLIDLVPAALEDDQTDDEVKEILYEYELALDEILRDRERRAEQGFRRPEEFEPEEVDELAAMHAAWPLHDARIRRLTRHTIDRIAAQLEPDARRRFLETADTWLYPNLPSRIGVMSQIDAALNLETITDEERARLEQMRQASVEALRARYPELKRLYDAAFDEDHIRQVARMQAESALGLYDGPIENYAAGYTEASREIWTLGMDEFSEEIGEILERAKERGE